MRTECFVTYACNSVRCHCDICLLTYICLFILSKCTAIYILHLLDKIEGIGHNDANTERSSDEDSDCRSLEFELFRIFANLFIS